MSFFFRSTCQALTVRTCKRQCSRLKRMRFRISKLQKKYFSQLSGFATVRFSFVLVAVVFGACDRPPQQKLQKLQRSTSKNCPQRLMIRRLHRCSWCWLVGSINCTVKGAHSIIEAKKAADAWAECYDEDSVILAEICPRWTTIDSRPWELLVGALLIWAEVLNR